MASLHFGGRADAYLEWAVASGFRWIGAAPGAPDRVDLLVDHGFSQPTPIHVATCTRAVLSTGSSALPAWSWMELAQAIQIHPRPTLVTGPEELVAKPRPVLGLIDSGIGQAWMTRQNLQRSVMYWDMETNIQPLQRASHGAHVLSWLAGQPPYPGGAWHGDLASRCPLILVNLPQQAVDDPSGRWLGRYLLDGLDYMVEQALALKATQLVLNISWGPQTGPHDGSSLLERALAQRIDRAKDSGLAVEIVLAAGNSRESRAHAQFDAAQSCDSLSWVVPPAGPAPSFLELWWPADTAVSETQVSVRSPDGRTLTQRGLGQAATSRAHLFIVAHPRSQGTLRPMALLALHPTGGTDRLAPHGRWQIGVNRIPGASGQVHAYVARQSANLGGRYRGPDSHLDDPGYGQQRFRRHPDPPQRGTCLTREGTLSGLASAAHPRIHVAAGAVLSTGQAALYSSQGPGAGGGLQHPDWALPTDETPGLRGLLGAGSRPGTSLRLVGTSMAAPQLARLLLNGLPPLPLPRPWDARLGLGQASLGWRSRHRP